MLDLSDLLTSMDQKIEDEDISLSKIKPWLYRKKAKFALEAPKNKTYSTSKWDNEENERYVDFLIKFKSILE